MSALASIKTSGWRASPLSSQWKPDAGAVAPDPAQTAAPTTPAAPRVSPLSSQWGKGLLSSAADASVAAGNVVSGKPAATNDTATQPTEGQTSPVAQKPVEGEKRPDLDLSKITKSEHWDGGSYGEYYPDGRVLRRQENESLDGSQRTTVGYELEEPTPKKGTEYGLNTDKKVHRIEVFDVNGKSKGYTYRLADERSLFKGFAQDFLATPIAAPLMGMAGAALAPGIASATGLSSAASQVAASGLIGGVTGAASGAGFGKGAVMGAVGGAINNYNPAGQLGVGADWQAPVNNAIKAGAGAAIKGDSIEDAVKGAVLNPANLLKLPGWKASETQS